MPIASISHVRKPGETASGHSMTNTLRVEPFLRVRNLDRLSVPPLRMADAIELAVEWMQLRRDQIALQRQEDDTWREMVRDGILRQSRSHARTQRDPSITRAASAQRRTTSLWNRVAAGDQNSTQPILHTQPVNYQPVWLSQWAQPVVVRPTEEEIEAATEETDFSSVENPQNDTCPITQHRFGPSSRVLRIRSCGHMCEVDALRRWFTYSVRCPLCRTDIRDNPGGAQEEGDNSTTLPNPLASAGTLDLAARLAREIAVQLNSEVEDSSGNLTVALELTGTGWPSSPGSADRP